MLELSSVKYKHLSKRMNNTIESGFIDYDRHIFDFKPGEVTIIFGRNGEGKSTVGSQILAHHMYRNKKAYLYSGELSESKIQEWLYRQIVGNNLDYYDIITTKYGDRHDFKPTVVEMVKNWHRDNLYIYNMKIDKMQKNTSKLFKDMETASLCGCTLFMIDNLMTAFAINENTQYADQSNFVQDCKIFATSTNTHIILIAHPNKSKEELTVSSTSGNLSKNDVSGTNNIANKADNIISVERVWKVKGIQYEEEIPDMYLTSLKDRESGQRAMFKYWFDNRSLRFYNSNTPKNACYNWQNTGVQVENESVTYIPQMEGGGYK